MDWYFTSLTPLFQHGFEQNSQNEGTACDLGVLGEVADVGSQSLPCIPTIPDPTTRNRQLTLLGRRQARSKLRRIAF